jgi:dipeptidyl aminopeptidase/acylaminoacyl peptidase
MRALWVLATLGCSGHVVRDSTPRLVWDSETIVQHGPLVEQVGYTSADGALALRGQICRPEDAARHSVIVLDHGGFAGIGNDGGLCVALAQQGHVVVEPSYRGEDGSTGDVEVCKGEVDDVLRMVAIAVAQPYADPDHVVVHGSSHGGCVTLRALERGLPVRAASEGFGITDMAADYAYWQAELASAPNGTYASTIQGLIDQLDRATGGAPAAQPAAYTARSPAAFASQLPVGMPLMIAHGTADPLVSVTQSCALAASLGGFRAYHLDAQLQVVTSAPVGCEGQSITWLPGPLPQAWPDARYLLVFDGVGHEFTSAGGMAMALDLLQFVLAKL